MATAEKEVSSEEIIYKVYQLRQLEINRNIEKKPSIKEALTMRIRVLKAEVDPLLERYAAQQKAKQSTLVVDKNVDDKDLGPEEAVAAMHTYAAMKVTQPAVLEHLNNVGLCQ